MLAACGSGTTSGTSATTAGAASVPLKQGESPSGQQLYGKRRGGVLTV